MSYIASVRTALAAHRYAQQDITDAFAALVSPDSRDQALLRRMHAATGVRHRHLALPLHEYPRLRGFDDTNRIFADVATSLGDRALRAALGATGLAAEDVDLLISTTVTGVVVPTVDARLVDRLGLREDVRRLPLFGLGCVAGAAGVARAHDYLRGHPDHVAVLLAVELCSLTVQRDDASVANLVASGLFGDGAAAVVLVGQERARHMGLVGPVVTATRSRFFPGTERVMGWDVGRSGFRVVLAPNVADIVHAHVGEDMKRFLVDHDLELADVEHWIAHPGGPKVLTALAQTLGVDDQVLQHTWQSLRDVGNLSSVSVLEVLQRTMVHAPTGSAEPAVMFAMGPGFSAEFVLMRW